MNIEFFAVNTKLYGLFNKGIRTIICKDKERIKKVDCQKLNFIKTNLME